MSAAALAPLSGELAQPQAVTERSFPVVSAKNPLYHDELFRKLPPGQAAFGSVVQKRPEIGGAAFQLKDGIVAQRGRI